MSRTIVLFGDSITQESFFEEINGWGLKLNRNYLRKADVLNKGLSGYNTRWAKKVVKEMFTGEAFPRLLFAVVFFGANDASMQSLNPQQHVPIEEYSNNLIEIIEHIKNLKTKAFIGISEQVHPQVVLVAPPMIDSDAWRETMIKKYNDSQVKENRNLETTKKYASAAAEVAKKTNVMFVDLFGEMEKHDDWKNFFSDGLHLSSKGNELMWKTLTDVIAKNAKSCAPDSLPMEYPDWKTVDNFNVENTLKRNLQ